MVVTRAKCRQEDPTVLALDLHRAFIVTGIVASVLLAAERCTKQWLAMVRETWNTIAPP